MRRFLCLLICVLLTVVATGSAALAELDKNTTATIQVFSWYDDDLLEAWVENFNKEYPNITVNYEMVGGVASFMEKFQAMKMTGTVPDIFLCVAENRHELTQADAVVDLTDTKLGSLISDAAKKQIEYNGRVYAIATGGSIGGMLVNLDLLKQAGITEPPKTWGEVIDMMLKLKDLGVIPFYDPLDDAALQIRDAAVRRDLSGV